MQASRIIKVALGVLFLLFTFFQLNDPDPWLWTSIYIALATFCFYGAFAQNNRKLLLGFAVLILVYACILIPEIVSWIQMGMPTIVESMKAEEPHIEYTREFFGLLISLVTILYLYKKQSNSTSKSS